LTGTGQALAPPQGRAASSPMRLCRQGPVTRALEGRPESSRG
jgi:hypothetical protein